MDEFDWDFVTTDSSIVDLFKQREEIEAKIREIDKMALLRYECEKLGLPQNNDK